MHLVRHMSSRRPHEPFAAAHALILSTHADGEHAYTVQRRGEAGPAGMAKGPADSPQARLAAQCMPRFWHMHAISCGIRLARELLAAVAEGYVGIVTAGAAAPSGERVSRTMQLRVPMLPSSTPASPKINVGGPQRSAGRQVTVSAADGSQGRVAGGQEDRAESVGLWDLSPAVSTPTSPSAHASGDRGLFPAWSIAAQVDTSQPGSATHRKSDSGSPGVRLLSPQAQASHIQEKLLRHALTQVQVEEDPRAAALEEAAVPGDGAARRSGKACGGGSANAEDGNAAVVAGPSASEGFEAGAVAAGGAGAGGAAASGGAGEAGEAGVGSAAEAPAATTPQESSGASMPPPAPAGSDTDKSLTLAPLPALLMHGVRMPEGIWGELPKVGPVDTTPSPTDTVPGSPSLDHMPSFSRWVSMSLSCSVSFGGPVRADSEVRSRRIAAPPAEQDGAVDRTESVCSPPSQMQARADGGSSRPSHPQISLAPPPPLPQLQSGRAVQLVRGVEVPSLDLGAGVCGSSSWLPEAPGIGARGTDLWAHASDVLYVPALLMSALCDVATGGRPGAAPAAAVPSAEPIAAGGVAVAAGAALAVRGATTPAAEASSEVQPAEPPPQAQPKGAANGTAAGEDEVVADAPAPGAQQQCAAAESGPAGEALDSRTLQGLVLTMDRDVIRGAHEALAVALRVPELTPQVRSCPTGALGGVVLL